MLGEGRLKERERRGGKDGGELRPGNAGEIREGDGRGQGSDPGAARQRQQSPEEAQGTTSLQTISRAQRGKESFLLT